MSRLLMNENEKWNKFIETPLYTKVGKVHSVQEQFFVAKVESEDWRCLLRWRT